MIKGNIQVLVEDKEIDFTSFNFPAGEVQVKIHDDLQQIIGKDITIVAQLQSSDDIMSLMMLNNIINMYAPRAIALLMPYIPYGRQDRVCAKGEAFAFKVFANLINSMSFDQVVVVDPHSDVSTALLDRVCLINKAGVLKNASFVADYDTFVAPDVGASKEVQELCITFGKEFIQGYKKRDPETGALSGFGFYGDVEGKNVLIVDDICDGGGTFLGLGEKLNEGKPEKLSLFVTHGIFSKGKGIFGEVFDNVYTTDYYDKNLVNYGNVQVYHYLK